MVTIVSTCWPQVKPLSSFRNLIMEADQVQRLSLWALEVSKGLKVTPRMRGLRYRGKVLLLRQTSPRVITDHALRISGK